MHVLYALAYVGLLLATVIIAIVYDVNNVQVSASATYTNVDLCVVA